MLREAQGRPEANPNSRHDECSGTVSTLYIMKVPLHLPVSTPKLDSDQADLLRA